jgi:hypothetical protein
MLTAVERTVHAIAFVLQIVPVGTNLGLAHLMWVMMNGSFLRSRGAVVMALHLNGMTQGAVRRSWAALRQGCWDVNELLSIWSVYVASQNQWHPRRHGGYSAFGVDITGFWRPKLQGWLGKHFHSLAQRALPAVVLGVMTHAGAVEQQRIPLLRRLLRCQPEMCKADFRLELLKAAKAVAQADEVIVVDAEFEINELQTTGVDRYVVRLASNATARRSQLPAYKGRGRRPEYGARVRPLPRHWKERQIEATAPDHETHFVYEGRTIQVAIWYQLVTVDTKVDAAAKTFTIYAYTDPAYKMPLLLATNLTCAPDTAYLLYRDRWPVEQPPLSAKQMIGLHRSFVFATESCFRLPELALFAGNMLSYLAATLPPFPTGFWDRSPKRTPGRLRRVLQQADFPNFTLVDPILREKDSVTDHLPKGISAHVRRKHAA